jgi:hypothetical protein
LRVEADTRVGAGSAVAPSHAEFREEYRQTPKNSLTQWLVALAGSLTVAGAAPDSSCTTVVVGLTGFPFQPLCANAPSGHLEAHAVYLMARDDALQEGFAWSGVVDPSLLGCF